MNNLGILVGTIIYIGRSFAAIDGQEIQNRFMCIVAVNKENLFLVPMSTYKSLTHRIKKLSVECNLDYSQLQGNFRAGYLKCDQLYVLSYNLFNQIKEVKWINRMNQSYFKDVLLLKIKMLAKKQKINKKFLFLENKK